jgi:RNA polymerase sigma-70 factor (ECF subfamily)
VDDHVEMMSGATTTVERDDKSDDVLFHAFARGDADAFDQLYGRYRQPLFGYLMKNCRDEATASEMFQDVWLRVISSISRYQERGKFRAWLFRLAHNRLVDHYRHVAKQDFEELSDVAALEPSVEEQVSKIQRESYLRGVISKLPLEQRSAFLLREEAGLSLREIAEIQEINLETAKSRLRYAYRKLSHGMQKFKPSG